MSYSFSPFSIDLSGSVPRMLSLVANARLPAKPEYPGVSNFGIELDYLQSLKDLWVSGWNWDEAQSEFNEYKQFKTTIEGIDLHFIHEKSADKDAIPLVLLHGWPGSFHEFIPVIKPLLQSATTPSGKNVSFDIIVPSLPGFTFSSAPPANWTVVDTGRIFNTLMTEVLGYETYALHGTDWGSAVGWSMYDAFNATVRAAHFDFLPFLGPTPEEAAAANVTLSAVGKVGTQRFADFQAHHFSYFREQSDEPNTIGFALYDNPLGQLSWIGELYKWGSDPKAGTAPSVLNSSAIITAVSLYFLTDSFVSAAYVYAQNPTSFGSVYSKARTDAPMLFSSFEWNVVYWPKEYAAKAGNLTYFKEHSFGGHFAGLDNPPALIDDIRHIGDFFERV
ncbi:hypothetical protein HWV62_9793 [Athelia sp. TMB]|nr:hypothetical protein HWV62_9793 [Athelia sp. TMB]